MIRISVTKLSAVILALVIALAMVPARASHAAEKTLTIFKITSTDNQVDVALIKRWAAERGVNVMIIFSQPTSNYLIQIQNRLAEKSTALDVIQFDTLATGILASELSDLTPALQQGKVDLASFFPALVEQNRVNGKLIGMPWHADASMLFYRTDLLQAYGFSQPPKTWVELEQMSATIQAGERAKGKSKFWGYVFQADAYEGLTGMALELQYGGGGGSIIEADRTISVNNAATIKALDQAKGWIGTISPKAVLNYREEEARRLFQSGDAAFMRNWPYAYTLAQTGNSRVKGKFAVAPLPNGSAAKTGHDLSGWELGVNASSPQADLATELVLYLTSDAVQKERAIALGKLPTLQALYTDSEVRAAIPYAPEFATILQSALARPAKVTVDKYNAVSIAYFQAVHEILAGTGDSATTLQALSGQLRDILGAEYPIGTPPK